MTIEQIERFIETKDILGNSSVKIDFKGRNSLIGIFIKTSDFNDLKVKNFWRIVAGDSLPDWKETKNNSLARIFSGSEITKLSVI